MISARSPRAILVLGCSAGTGAAVARAVARAPGLDVIGLHRGNHPESAAALRRAVEGAGRSCVLLEADAGRLELIPELADRVARALGDDEAGLLACVHALADASVGPLVHPEAERALHPAQIGKTFEVMAHSFVVWAQALLERRLFAPGAQMLAMLNYLDTQTLRTAGAIGASKAALAAYVAYLGLELAPHGVRANAIRFGAADTEAASLLPRYDVILRNLASVSPMRRNVEVDDVGALVSLLLDPRAGFLNGAVIPFDGGELAAFGNLFAREMAR